MIAELTIPASCDRATQELQRRVSDALVALGRNADEVADSLRLLDCVGVRCECRLCPIARYLELRFPSMNLSVGLNNVIRHGEVFVKMPNPVRVFVRKFDTRQYLDLLEAA
jgi:hypothetical protein